MISHWAMLGGCLERLQFITMTFKSTLIRSSSNSYYHMYESIISICKLFVLDKKTWLHITASKTLKKQLQKKCKYERTMNAIP